MTRATYQGTRADLQALGRRLALMLAGREPDRYNVRRDFLEALGVGALSDIQTAFITKARGGTDEMGIRWEPLKPETIANRRVSPRDIRTDPAIAERQRIIKRETRRLLPRLRLSLPEDQAKARAKQLAGAIATRQTGRTKVQTLGGRQVDILRDTGVLFNSLSPGLEYGDGIFLTTNNSVIVGSSVAYAAAHQYGTSRIPARPFLPPTADSVPDIWWERWMKKAQKAYELSISRVIQAGGRP